VLVKTLGNKKSIHCWWECKLGQPVWKSVWRFFEKLKIDLLCNSAIPLLGVYPKGYKSGSNRDTCKPMFIAALFTTAKLCNQPRCPSTNKGNVIYIHTHTHIHTPEYHSLYRRMKLCPLQENGWKWKNGC
jgi:hypothetical protein